MQSFDDTALSLQIGYYFAMGYLSILFVSLCVCVCVLRNEGVNRKSERGRR